MEAGATSPAETESRESVTLTTAAVPETEAEPEEETEPEEVNPALVGEDEGKKDEPVHVPTKEEIEGE